MSINHATQNISTRSKTIFLLHFAGGNCYSFKFLTDHLPGHKIIVLELPARGRRMAEPLIKTADEAVRDLLDQFLKHNIRRDFIIYGHSLGATLGLLLTRELESRQIFPDQLIVTGSCGPYPEKVSKRRYELSSPDFKQMLRGLGGISEEVLDEKELFEYFEPIIRADFELLERENIVLSYPVKTPVHALMGHDEDDQEHIENWRSLTGGTCVLERWPGEHFFIYDHVERLASLITDYANARMVNM